MAITKAKNSYTHMLPFARNLLLATPLVPVTTFEEKLLHRFRDTLPSGHTQTGRSRERNLVDWVKARMTEESRFFYSTVGDVRVMVALPPSVGEVNGVRLSSTGAACGIIQRIMLLLGK